ncbi:D-aminoacyl-tRNA deacylase [Candidatus Methanocrinis natronophilus]|uniref:D-aminoacyl-tRNA deacylase n=1 Tax=Candidatus Methanocrinis natronophilus TaxID=3033396 RepID=A0ABT5X772_9EURY|nr:D-aminoacyl-tRNA deacylase [Candidatus Methanocrinis natronophilus]MDF0590549.1 D-aminoacyl-tRNA deacylase [Candidatus Methanocrinis natronophilus]
MTAETVVVATSTDPASINIAESLLSLAPWRSDGGPIHRFANYSLVVFDEKLIHLENLESSLEGIGLSPDLIVFASRHQAKDGIPRLCGHFSGNCGEAMMGGRDKELAVPAPSALKSFILGLAADPLEGFDITVEATHHGPTDLNVPSFFAEIGSYHEQWRNPYAGRAVARSILSLQYQDLPALIGFGGGHYVTRQNRLMMETGVVFGHLFSKYQAEGLDAEIVEEAVRTSGAVAAYLDRKSLRSAVRVKIVEAVEDIGLPAMREREIRETYPLEETAAPV